MKLSLGDETGSYLEHDWFPARVPENIVLDPKAWIYSSYAFFHVRSEQMPAIQVGRHSGVYAGSRFVLGRNGRVTIGEYCTLVGPVISTNASVTIGNHVMIATEVFISDRPFAFPDDINSVDAGSRDIVIGENAWIGTRAVILGGARIGESAIIGAAAVVDFEVPPFAIVAGNPGTIVGWAEPRAKAS